MNAQLPLIAYLCMCGVIWTHNVIAMTVPPGSGEPMPENNPAVAGGGGGGDETATPVGDSATEAAAAAGNDASNAGGIPDCPNVCSTGCLEINTPKCEWAANGNFPLIPCKTYKEECGEACKLFCPCMASCGCSEFDGCEGDGCSATCLALLDQVSPQGKKMTTEDAAAAVPEAVPLDGPLETTLESDNPDNPFPAHYSNGETTTEAP